MLFNNFYQTGNDYPQMRVRKTPVIPPEPKLPPFTLRFKANRAVTTADFRNELPITLSLVDEATHTYDVTLEQPDWSLLFMIDFEEIVYNDWLTEVVAANTSGVTNMMGMFGLCKKLTSVQLFDTHAVTSMEGMFGGCEALASVPLFDTSNVAVTTTMFMDCTALVSVPLLNTGKATDMSYMFSGCEALASVPLFDTSNVDNVYAMLTGCRNVESGALALYTQMSTQENPPTSYGDAFKNCGADTAAGLAELKQIPTDWGGNALPPFTLRFRANRAITTADLYRNPGELTLVDDANHIYDLLDESRRWINLLRDAYGTNDWLVEVIDANLGIDGWYVEDMSYAFADCVQLISVPLFNMSNITKMDNMFYNCRNVESGALALYQQASTQANPPTSYENAFTDCGVNTQTGLAELQQIPADWGGLKE